jgi:hypothetical protein
MWTLGRDREKEQARKFLGPSKDSSLIEAVIDVVHDLIEAKVEAEAVRAIFRRSFVEGCSGVWESTGSWLLKVGREFPDFFGLWDEFAAHSSAATRFRVAAFVGNLPEDAVRKLLPALLADPSTKVRRKLGGDQHDAKWEWVYPLLVERRAIEGDPSVIEALDFAIEAIEARRQP